MGDDVVAKVEDKALDAKTIQKVEITKDVLKGARRLGYLCILVGIIVGVGVYVDGDEGKAFVLEHAKTLFTFVTGMISSQLISSSK